MKRFAKKPVITALLVLVGIVACVTINIYFPAEKVESVAGEIVHDIRGKGTNNEKQPLKDKQGSLMKKTVMALSVPMVWAAEETNVSNPTIRALKEKMKTRFSQMQPFYQKGNLKEGDDGYVSIANTDGLGLKEKRDLKGLSDAENEDRQQLYKEVAKALNIDSGQISRVAQIFSKEWQKSVK